ncbi:hypothetical protein AGMMS49592_0350 [Endomicrobiia bacterium]|nr:hypothetical protein AGMMS49592_0350 [Endomicrobiia bacterium]
MAMTALELVKEIANNLSEDERINDISSGTTNKSALKILSTLNMSLKRAILAYDWNVLYRIAESEDTEGIIGTDHLPGFNGIITDCIYNLSKNTKIERIYPSEYIANKQLINPSTCRYNVYCLFNNAINFSEDVIGSDITFMYRTNAAVRNSEGMPKYTFTDNTDTCDLDDGLLIRGGIMYYSKNKMDEDWSQDVAEYETYLKQLISMQEPPIEIFAR